MSFITPRTIAMIKKNPKDLSEGRMVVVLSSPHFKFPVLDSLSGMRAERATSTSEKNGHKGSKAAAEGSPPAREDGERLEINKACSLSSVELKGGSVLIGMEFEGGGSLKMELEKDSIYNIYSSGGGYYHPRPSLQTISGHLVEFIMDGKIAEVRKESRTVDEVMYEQEVTLTRADGVQLVVEISPDATTKIELYT